MGWTSLISNLIVANFMSRESLREVLIGFQMKCLRTLLDSTLKQLKRAGFRVVVAHGHGPSTNHFINMIPQLKEKYDLECFTC